ncbi:MAG: DUF5808 domain-containing protein [Thermoplasmata archaeon]|nr:DUF5808 domain-containing protein [Thermoplasmata archaeon]
MDFLWLEGLALTLLLFVVALVTPRLSAPRFRFGVSVPPAHRDDPRLLIAGRVYQAGVAIGGLAALPPLALGATPELDYLAFAAPLLLLSVTFLSYLIARQQVLRAKRVAGWVESGPRMGVAELVPAEVDTTWGAWVLLPLAVWVGFLVWGIALYPSLPATLPIHFDASGAPNSFAMKSPLSVFAGSIVGAGVLAIFALLAAAITRSRAPLDPQRPRSDAQRQFQFRFQMVRALLVFAALVELTVGLASLETWKVVGSTGVGSWILLIPIVAGVALLLGVSVRLGQLGARMPLSEEPGLDEDPDVAGRRARDDDRNWIAGVMYWNREDSALLIPRRFGVGWTLNWGNRWSWVLLGALMGVPFLILIAAALG